MDVTALRIYDTCVWEVAVKSTAFFHLDRGIGCFATTSIAAMEAFEFYYGSLAHDHLGLRVQQHNTYSVGVMSVLNTTFSFS